MLIIGLWAEIRPGKGVLVDALLELEPRDAGHMPTEPQAEFGTSVDDLHDRVRCSPTICITDLTDQCHVVTA
jgi:hypothetical protein